MVEAQTKEMPENAPPAIRVFTIGFTKKSAEEFFKLLARAGVRRIVDVRLNNVSQLAGFSKRDDLRYFLRAICDTEYVHLPELSPTRVLLDEYNKHGRDWPRYEQRFLSLITERHIEQRVPKDLLDQACLLCSEGKPDYCHRRLVAEYFRRQWGDLNICHL